MTKNLSIKEQFLSYVSIPENPDGCWEWIGSKHKNGYGKFGINYKTHCTHRVSFELFVGVIPEGLFVCHSCDNRACVNLAHLFLGTRQDNMTDMINKNRQVRGEDCYNHKITEQDIYQIREMIEQGYKLQKIANMFDMTLANVSCIKHRKSWKWLK